MAEKANWRWIPYQSWDPFMNMAIDEAMMIAHNQGLVPPTLRFYGWEPATLTLGYFQRARDEVDTEQLREKGIGLVRRATGGRAVLHDRELTYSIVISEKAPGIPRGEFPARKLPICFLVGHEAGIIRPIASPHPPPKKTPSIVA